MPELEDLLNGHRLRLLRESDADELHALIEANHAYLARWMAWAQGQTRAQTLDFIRSAHRQMVGNAGFHLAVVDDAGRIVGVVGFIGVDWTNRAASIGYWLAEAAQGQGTMTEAVRSLVAHALEEWKLHRVEIRAEPENLRSRAIAQRLGFQQEGTLRQVVRFGERYADHVVYAMLAGEWPDGRGRLAT